jgi:CDP-diacylglycerol--serine O-phosphatidyltransferase
LARYNVTSAALADDTGKVRYFEGTPIPTSMLLVALLGFLAWQGYIGTNLPLGEVEVLGWHFHPFVLVYFVLGSTMISKTLRIPKP